MQNLSITTAPASSIESLASPLVSCLLRHTRSNPMTSFSPSTGAASPNILGPSFCSCTCHIDYTAPVLQPLSPHFFPFCQPRHACLILPRTLSFLSWLSRSFLNISAFEDLERGMSPTHWIAHYITTAHMGTNEVDDIFHPLDLSGRHIHFFPSLCRVCLSFCFLDPLQHYHHHNSTSSHVVPIAFHSLRRVWRTWPQSVFQSSRACSTHKAATIGNHKPRRQSEARLSSGGGPSLPSFLSCTHTQRACKHASMQACI